MRWCWRCAGGRGRGRGRGRGGGASTRARVKGWLQITTASVMCAVRTRTGEGIQRVSKKQRSSGAGRSDGGGSMRGADSFPGQTNLELPAPGYRGFAYCV